MRTARASKALSVPRFSRTPVSSPRCRAFACRRRNGAANLFVRQARVDAEALCTPVERGMFYNYTRGIEFESESERARYTRFLRLLYPRLTLGSRQG
jgi:hypothetical protein